MSTSAVNSMRAVEALRSGVPSQQAVVQLGTTQTEVLQTFRDRLTAVRADEPVTPLVIAANFGAGKSHLLKYLQSVAESDGFVTSFIVISPETPLGNSHVVLKAISESARAPGRVGKALRALSVDYRVDSIEFQELSEWVSRNELPDRFLALLRLYEQFRADEEFRFQILSDFEGKPLTKSVINQRLREAGDSGHYLMPPTRNAFLAHDRIRLLARLFHSAGHGGLVVLFDELERTAKFSAKQRIAVYQELGWWRNIAEAGGSRILPVFAMTDAFVGGSITGGTHDEDRFQSSGGSEPDARDLQALVGIEMLKPPCPFYLDSPTSNDEVSVYRRVREIYQQAYGLSPSDISNRGVVRTSIRSTIRRWITLWDMQRYFGDDVAEISDDDVVFDSSPIEDETLNAFDQGNDIE